LCGRQSQNSTDSKQSAFAAAKGTSNGSSVYSVSIQAHFLSATSFRLRLRGPLFYAVKNFAVRVNVILTVDPDTGSPSTTEVMESGEQFLFSARSRSAE
jgi:hypothetical protein